MFDWKSGLSLVAQLVAAAVGSLLFMAGLFWLIDAAGLFTIWTVVGLLVVAAIFMLGALASETRGRK